MTTYLITIGLIFALLSTLIGVDKLYRRFANRHPESGPYREKSFGCGSCKKEKGCECEEEESAELRSPNS
jgi:hypothetical protein